MIQRRPPSEPPESPYSSPTTASPGRSSASRARTARSTAVSASVTGVRSGLVSTTRSAARNRATVIASARSASSSASAQVFGGGGHCRAGSYAPGCARLTVSMAANDLERETTDVLRQLVRFNTVNPPGNERAAIEFLAGYLNDAGLKTELLADDEDRPNLVADLAADSPNDGGPDNVLPRPRRHGARRPVRMAARPWSGDVADGFLWGRGALDMKSQVAAEAVAAANLARGGWRPRSGLPEARVRLRRGDRRRRRSALAGRHPSRPGPLRHAAQRGRRRRVRVRREAAATACAAPRRASSASS